MDNMEKAIKGLECCVLRDPDDKSRCEQCPYDGACLNRLKHDALVLLKSQEQELRYRTSRKVEHEATLKRCCTCPSCGNVLDQFEQFGVGKVRIMNDYCHFCGQALDWSDEEKSMVRFK